MPRLKKVEKEKIEELKERINEREKEITSLQLVIKKIDKTLKDKLSDDISKYKLETEIAKREVEKTLLTIQQTTEKLTDDLTLLVIG